MYAEKEKLKEQRKMWSRSTGCGNCGIPGAALLWILLCCLYSVEPAKQQLMAYLYYLLPYHDSHRPCYVSQQRS